MQDSDDEDLEHDIDQQIESMFATKRTVKEIKAPLGIINPASINAQNTAIDKLELAKRLASKINLTKSMSGDTKFATQQAAESILKGSGSQPLITAKTVAEQLAAKLNTRLNYQPKDDEDRNDDDSEQTFRKYEEELEINDFPQQARWRVTSKVSNDILKFTKTMLHCRNATFLYFRNNLRIPCIVVSNYQCNYI